MHRIQIHHLRTNLKKASFPNPHWKGEKKKPIKIPGCTSKDILPNHSNTVTKNQLYS